MFCILVQEKRNKNIMQVSEFILKTTKETAFGMGFTEIRPRIVCNDGFNLSIQCGKGSYSTPRDLSIDYTAVEIGYPSKEEPLINEYAEGSNYTHTVYGWVPVTVIEEVVKKHGGINITETFKKK